RNRGHWSPLVCSRIVAAPPNGVGRKAVTKWLRGCYSRREATTDLEPAPWLILRHDGPATGHHDVLDDGQPKSSARRGTSAIGSIEAFEEPGEVAARYAHARIRTDDHELVVLAPSSNGEGRSSSRMANRILCQVLHYGARQPTSHRELELRLHVGAQFYVVHLRTVPQLRKNFCDHAGEMCSPTQGQRSTFELAQEEHLVDEL